MAWSQSPKSANLDSGQNYVDIMRFVKMLYKHVPIRVKHSGEQSQTRPGWARCVTLSA